MATSVRALAGDAKAVRIHPGFGVTFRETFIARA
jgi:hypothetical protein